MNCSGRLATNYDAGIMEEHGRAPIAVKRTSARVRRSLVIPMYRERSRITATLTLLAGSELDAEHTQLLLVDDGSDDDTVSVAVAESARLGLGCEVLRVAHRGKGSAVAAGMLAASGDAVAFTDADLSTGVTDIVACLAAVESDEADVVVGTRAHALSQITKPGSAARKMSGWGYNTVLRGLGLTSLRDTQCGLKGFTRDAAEALFSDLSTPGFAFDIEILARAERLGLRLHELPVTWSHVEASRVRIARDAPRMLLDAVRIRRVLRDQSQPHPVCLDLRDDQNEALVRSSASAWVPELEASR